MFLYKLEVQLADRRTVLILMGDSDEEVMDSVEAHLSKHFIGSPEVKEIALVEKRRAGKGAGYVVEL
ncbi:DUF3906 family protein [Cohnella pontilimi]|uniref:DUF3906 family protein n=1 Tax=Cohnella pontilimi TaxID=2564100 RepID=A0A4U0F9K5_9BACL|nr:DUF3906 family protein [Cohnella pontilimi]TJY41395.1 DUF3906 family protein [Cohnella pontilimi]